MSDRLRKAAERMADAVAAYRNIGSAPTDLSAAIDRLASIMQEIFAAEVDLRAALAEERVPLTDEQIASACLSYRHDFGLLEPREQRILMREAREWDRALSRERAHGIGGEDE